MCGACSVKTQNIVYVLQKDAQSESLSTDEAAAAAAPQHALEAKLFRTHQLNPRICKCLVVLSRVSSDVEKCNLCIIFKTDENEHTQRDKE